MQQISGFAGQHFTQRRFDFFFAADGFAGDVEGFGQHHEIWVVIQNGFAVATIKEQ
ncbi:Uncharacterised protein [Vibrio cholerae]|nr:Uncharacterised protein [Vibrio cholerae]